MSEPLKRLEFKNGFRIVSFTVDESMTPELIERYTRNAKMILNVEDVTPHTHECFEPK